MAELKPFQFEHFDLFAWRDEDQKTYNINSEFIKAFVNVGKESDCWTLVDDGRIVCIGGVLRQTEKTGYCFTVFSKYAKPATARTVRRMFKAIMWEMRLHRVVTYNRITAGAHHRWCEWLGFELEGTVRKFDDEGNDYFQYGLVTDGH